MIDWQRITRHAALPVGVLLTIAAFLKLIQLSTSPQENAALQFLFLGVELFVAISLLSDTAGRWIRAFSIFLFSCFSIYQFTLILHGTQSCNCFGDVMVAPIVTLFIDVLAIALLVIWEPRPDVDKGARRKIQVITAFTLCFMAIPVFSFRPSTLNAAGVIVGDESTVLLEPDDWVGNSLPIMSHIVNSFPMHRGRWTLLLYEDNCSSCRAAIEEFKSLNSQVPKAFVSLNAKDFRAERNGIWTSLASGRKWIAKVPIFIELEDSMVIDTSDSGVFLEAKNE